MHLPYNYVLEGGAEGMRHLFEDVPVRRIVALGEGSIEHPRRKVASFTKKAKKSEIEGVALLDRESRSTLSEADRKHCLSLLADMFRKSE